MIRIGIICPSEIALRRFLPALNKLSDFKFIGVAYANENEWQGATNEIIQVEKEKAEFIIDQYGGKLFHSYTQLIESNQVDAVYLPLPPALHYKWAKKALEFNKHILIEKPATISLSNTKELIKLSKDKGLAVHENYMFTFHKQLKEIDELIQSGKIGDIRLYRISFGFPRRSSNDFRYNKLLGGGALLDCGGYTIKYASMLLGETAKIVHAQTNYNKEFDVDIYGSGTLINEEGVTVQIAFGMDNSYKCDLEVWGSKGNLFTGRILTAPAGFIPEATVKIGNETEVLKLSEDDTFKKSIEKFKKCVLDDEIRIKNYKDIIKQAELVEVFLKKDNINNHAE